jgi:hypothetical protein
MPARSLVEEKPADEADGVGSVSGSSGCASGVAVVVSGMVGVLVIGTGKKSARSSASEPPDTKVSGSDNEVPAGLRRGEDRIESAGMVVSVVATSVVVVVGR